MAISYSVLDSGDFKFQPPNVFQVDKGMRDVLVIDELFDCKPAVNASFHYAKDKSQVYV